MRFSSRTFRKARRHARRRQAGGAALFEVPVAAYPDADSGAPLLPADLVAAARIGPLNDAFAALPSSGAQAGGARRHRRQTKRHSRKRQSKRQSIRRKSIRRHSRRHSRRQSRRHSRRQSRRHQRRQRGGFELAPADVGAPAMLLDDYSKSGLTGWDTEASVNPVAFRGVGGGRR